jgi:hypothetical protein
LVVWWRQATTWLKKESEQFVHSELSAGRNVFASSGSLYTHQQEEGGVIGSYVEDAVTGSGTYTPQHLKPPGVVSSQRHEEQSTLQEASKQADGARTTTASSSATGQKKESTMEHHHHGIDMVNGDASTCPFARNNKKKQA